VKTATLGLIGDLRSTFFRPASFAILLKNWWFEVKLTALLRHASKQDQENAS